MQITKAHLKKHLGLNIPHKSSFSSTSYTQKTKDEVVSRIHKHNINTVTMGFPDLYGRFIGKKYDSDYFAEKALKNGSNACNYLLSCDMEYNPIPNTSIASYERGFGDFVMKADIDSLREINYVNEQKQLLIFADLFDQKDQIIAHAPRHLLRRQIEDLKILGLSIKVQCDINFTLFHDKYRKLSENFGHAQTVTEHSNHYNTFYNQSLDDFLNKIRNNLKVSGINVEKIIGDKAPGQFRLSLSAADPLEFCDNIVLLKLCIKKLADEADKSATFMAKLNEDFNGNSLNLKLIIEDAQKNNILENYKYNSSTNVAKFNDEKGEHTLSGILYHLSDFLVFYAPTVNSYKRFKEAEFENWNKLGLNQDDCGVNIIEEKNTNKILFTLPGSDVNPYLTLFSLCNSIKSGVENKYTLSESFDHINKLTLPLNLNEALDNFKINPFLKNIFKEELHQHFWAFYNLEYTEFMNQVDEWETNRYLFQI